MHCVFCNHDLDDRRARPAFDPWLGRLWRVCPSCQRWNVVPLEDRWERMESYERATRDGGRTLLRSAHLDLVDTDDGQVIRVGRAPRPELAGWRYGDALPSPAAGGFLAWLRRLLLDLPSSTFGYNAGHGAGLFESLPSERWFASPFLDHAPALTAAFLHVPLTDTCPSCGGPLAVPPWRFQALRLLQVDGEPHVTAECGLCAEPVAVPLREARPALRLGLAIVTRESSDQGLVETAATQLEGGGPEALLDTLVREELALGEAPAPARLALGMALDEISEAELLEAEWRQAEELARIVDGELTAVPGFEAFRARVLG